MQQDVTVVAAATNEFQDQAHPTTDTISPVVSSNIDTVTETSMTVAIAQLGGTGVLVHPHHSFRNGRIEVTQRGANLACLARAGFTGKD
jgi:hypothetical protein